MNERAPDRRLDNGFHCGECGHRHTGRKWGYICVGCPCDINPLNGMDDLEVVENDQ